MVYVCPVAFNSDEAVNELLQTYTETGGINYLDVAAILQWIVIAASIFLT